jgi:hypothetical protein
MPLKSVQHPITKHIFKFGRKRPVARGPRLSLKNYLTRSLPTARYHRLRGGGFERFVANVR